MYAKSRIRDMYKHEHSGENNMRQGNVNRKEPLKSQRKPILRQKASVHVTLTVGRHFRGLASTKFGVPTNYTAYRVSDTTTSDPSITSPPFDDRNTVKMVSAYLEPKCVRLNVPAARVVLENREE
jgi:hypothetical protein